MLGTPNSLRLAAAIILGIIIGSILFFIVALFIGTFNDLSGMHLSVSTDLVENIWSAILLVVLILISVILLCWKVWTTPPTIPEEDESGSGDGF